MIIDGFTFFNELDLLEIRLHELNPVVDYFVLVEATKTHSNQPKPLFFKENQQRYAQFLPKIKHIIVDDLPDDDDPWVREKYQRRMIINRGFEGFPPFSIGMVSDLDEIPSAEVVAKMPQSLVEAGRAIGVLQFFCYYYANRLLCNKDRQMAEWLGTRVAQIHAWEGLTGREGVLSYVFGGWHMSYLGGLEAIKYKLRSYAHHKDKDHQNAETEAAKSLKENRLFLHSQFGLQCVDFDCAFWPKYLRDNQQKFSHLIG